MANINNPSYEELVAFVASCEEYNTFRLSNWYRENSIEIAFLDWFDKFQNDVWDINRNVKFISGEQNPGRL